MSRQRPTGDGENGFTMVEMMVTIGLALIVLFAILGASEIFGRSASVADKTTAAQDAARATVRDMVHVLRQGRPVCLLTTPCPTGPFTPLGGTPSRSDLVVAAYVTTPAGSDQLGWVRYCATSDPHPSLVKGVRLGDAYQPAGACSASDTTNGWSQRVVLNATLQDTGSLFDYTSACATGCTNADIQAVGIRLAVGTSPEAAAKFNSVVRDAVSFRNRSTT